MHSVLDIKWDTRITVIKDDGGVLEALCLAYNSAVGNASEEMPLAFTYADLYGFTIRDPTAEETKLAGSVFTILTLGTKVKIIKNSGRPVAASTIKELITVSQEAAIITRGKLGPLSDTRFFSGKLS